MCRWVRDGCAGTTGNTTTTMNVLCKSCKSTTLHLPCARLVCQYQSTCGASPLLTPRPLWMSMRQGCSWGEACWVVKQCFAATVPGRHPMHWVPQHLELQALYWHRASSLGRCGCRHVAHPYCVFCHKHTCKWVPKRHAALGLVGIRFCQRMCTSRQPENLERLISLWLMRIQCCVRDAAILTTSNVLETAGTTHLFCISSTTPPLLNPNHQP